MESSSPIFFAEVGRGGTLGTRKCPATPLSARPSAAVRFFVRIHYTSCLSVVRRQLRTLTRPFGCVTDAIGGHVPTEDRCMKQLWCNRLHLCRRPYLIQHLHSKWLQSCQAFQPVRHPRSRSSVQNLLSGRSEAACGGEGVAGWLQLQVRAHL